MKKILLFIITIIGILALPSSAQVLDQEFIDFYRRHATEKALENLVKGIEPGYTGSPWLSEEFTDGDIYLKGGKFYKNIPLRYNVYKDNIEFRMEEKVMVLPNSLNPDSIVIGDETFIYTEYTYNKGRIPGYLIMIYSGSWYLLKKYKVDFIPKVPPGAYKESKPAQFRMARPDYFITGGLVEVPTYFNNEKSLQKLTAINATELKNYIKNNRTNFRDDNSLIELFRHIDKQ